MDVHISHTATNEAAQCCTQMVLLLFIPIYLTPYNLAPYITPQSFNPAIYSPRNWFNTEIFYLFRRPKEQLAKLKFKGLRQDKTTELQECVRQLTGCVCLKPKNNDETAF